MASLAEQIAAAVHTALLGAIPAVGTRVYRAREDAISREECPAIVVITLSETADIAEMDATVDECSLTLGVDVHVAAGEAAPWETAADTICVLAHGLVRAATYPGTSGPPQRIARTWTAESGDASPGICRLVYRFDYWTAAADLSAEA